MLCNELMVYTICITVGAYLCRSWKMEDNLTFDNLYELLEKFSKTSETNKKFAEAMSERISKGINWNEILYLFYFNIKHRG